MTLQLGSQVQVSQPQNDGEERKGIKQFYMLKTLEANHIVEGIHQGTFESKKTPGYFFHVFKAADGEVYAYGACQALDDRIKMVTEKQKETGKKLYAKIKYNGRIPSKKNAKMTYYSFNLPELYEVTEAAPVSSDDIPF